MTLTLHGIIPPLVTPLSARDQLDAAGLERLIDRVIAGGVHGIFILGTTGEAPSLSYRLRREVIKRSVDLVRGRIPVLVGVTDTAFVESVALANHAADCGADAVVLTTPYYFPTGQTELLDYTRQIVREFPLPTILYNMPGMTKVSFEPATLRQLCDERKVIGVKDSGGDIDYFEQVCALKKERPDWSVFIGPEAMIDRAIALGGDGGVAGGANVFPRLFVRAYDACVSGDTSAKAAAMEAIRRLQRMYEIGKYPSRFIKATKSALSILGVCSDLPADPFHVFLPPERQRVAEVLEIVQTSGLT